MKVKCVCEFCGKEFERDHWMVERSKHTVCSHKCWDELSKKIRYNDPDYFNYECPICGKKMHMNKYDLNHGIHCCSMECSKVLRSRRSSGSGNHQYGLRGNLNASWKGGKTTSSYGYTLVRLPEHPFANGDGNVFEHRLVAEQYLLTDDNSIEINGKRYLKPEMHIHHKDENRKNNDPDNLVVLTKSEHTRLHNLKRSQKKDLKTGRFISG